MDHIPKKSKAFIITLIAVVVLLILGYFLFSHKDSLFSTKGTSTTTSKTFVPLDATPKANTLTTIDGVPVSKTDTNIINNGISATMTIEAGEDIKRCNVVYESGTNINGQRIVLKSLASDPAKAHVLGIATEDISKGQAGAIAIAGAIKGLAQTCINGANLQPGQLVYLSDSVAGQMTITRPSAPSAIIIIATISGISGANTGDINPITGTTSTSNGSAIDVVLGNHPNDFSTYPSNKGNDNINIQNGSNAINTTNSTGSSNGAGATFLGTISNVFSNTISGIGNFFGSLFGGGSGGGTSGSTTGGGNLGTGTGLGTSTGGNGTGFNTGTGFGTSTGGNGTGFNTGTGFGTGTGTGTGGFGTGGGFGSGTGTGTGGFGTGGGFDTTGGGGGGGIGLDPLPTPIDSGTGGGSNTSGGGNSTGGNTNCTDANGDPIACNTIQTTPVVTSTPEMCPSDDPLVFTNDEKVQLDALLKKYYILAPSMKSDEDIKVVNDDLLKNKSIIEQATSLISDCKAQKADPNYTGPQSIRDNPYYSAPTQVVVNPVTPVNPTNPTDCVDQSTPLNSYFNDPSTYYSNLFGNGALLPTTTQPCKPNYGQGGTTTTTITSQNSPTYLPGQISEYMTDVKGKRNGVPIDGSGYAAQVSNSDGTTYTHHPVLDYTEFETLFHIW